MTTHLVIGDPHAVPGVSNERFLWLGRLIVSKQPEVVVCMGDIGSMESLSSYDKGKKSFEGRRYQLDVASVVEALGLINRPIEEHNARCRTNRKAQYRPRKVMLGGNHEDRIDKAINSQPELDGTIGLHDLQFERHGWEFVPYRAVVTIDGISYSHNFPSGIMGESIGGLDVAKNLLAKQMTSCTVGHGHTLDHSLRVRPDFKRLHGLSAGCYVSDEWRPSYAMNTRHMWWSGIVLCNNVNDGDYDIETLSLARIRDEYSREQVDE